MKPEYINDLQFQLLVAHAPRDPWPQFSVDKTNFPEPNLPPAILDASWGVKEEDVPAIKDWAASKGVHRSDFVQSLYPKLATAWRGYWIALDNRERAVALAYRAQWPWFYASTIMAGRPDTHRVVEFYRWDGDNTGAPVMVDVQAMESKLMATITRQPGFQAQGVTTGRISGNEIGEIRNTPEENVVRYRPHPEFSFPQAVEEALRLTQPGPARRVVLVYGGVNIAVRPTDTASAIIKEFAPLVAPYLDTSGMP